jgi:type I restriction enzyme, S subunit
MAKLTKFCKKSIEKITDTIIDYRGKTPPKTHQGIKLITAKVIKGGTIIDGEHEYIDTDYYDSWMTRGLPKQWDILITTEAPLGEVAQLRTSEKVALAQRVILLRGNPSEVDQNYLFQALKSPLVQAELMKRATGTTVSGIKQSELRQVQVPIPPLPVQRKIAAILSAYDDLIENNTRRIAILEQMAQAIYHEWFVEFRFPDHEQVRMIESEIGLVPEGWEVIKLEEVCKKIASGGTPSRKESIFWENANIPWFKTQELQDGHLFKSLESISQEGMINSSAKLFPVNTILIAIYGATIGQLGVLTCESTFNQAACGLIANDKYVSPFFLYLTLLNMRNHFKNLGQGAAQQNISVGLIRTTRIMLPSFEVMQKFRSISDSMFEKIRYLRQQNINLRLTRDLLLPKLIGGEVDVSEMEIAGIDDESMALQEI